MGASLKRKLEPIKEQVLKAVKERGRRVAMQEFGIKTYRTFSKWLYETTQDPHFGIEHNKLAGMSGGVKSKWLRENREHIIWYFETFGKEKTAAEFSLTHNTLEQLLARPESIHPPKFTKADRAEAQAQIALEATRQLRGELNELKAQFAHFQESVGEQLLRRFLVPLLQSAILVDTELEIKPEPNLLSIDSLARQVKAYQNSIRQHSPKSLQLTVKTSR